MKTRWIALSLCIMFFCPASHAFVYIAPPFDKALQSKELVCVGLVEGVHITGKGLGWIRAQARLAIEKCLRGTHCPEGKTISVTYFAQNVLGTTVSLDIEVGKQVILAIADTDPVHGYELDTDINGGVDYVYTCNAFPASIIEEDHDFPCRNAMTRNVHRVTWSQIEKLFSGKP